MDRYLPDLLWFDFGLRCIPEPWKRGFVASYYNRAEARGREVAIAYKWHGMPPGCGVEDIEQGSRGELSCDFWLTDTTVDAGETWGYV